MAQIRQSVAQYLAAGSVLFLFASAALMGWRWRVASPVVNAAVPATLVAVDPASMSLAGMKGETLWHHLRIQNISTRAIRLAALRPSCECTDVKLDKFQLGPGETADAALTIETAGRPSAFIVAAPFEASAVDHSERVIAEVSVVIRGDVGLSNDAIDFGAVRCEEGDDGTPGHRILKRFSIRLPAGGSLSGPLCELAKAPEEQFLAVEVSRVSDADDAGLTFWGTALLDPRKAKTDGRGFLTSATIDVNRADGDLARRFVIRLSGRIAQRVASEPSVLYWSKEGLSAAQTLTIASDNGDHFRISGVDCEKPTLVRWELLQAEGSRAVLTLTPSDRARSPGVLRSQLRLVVEFDDGRPERLLVPIVIL